MLSRLGPLAGTRVLPSASQARDRWGRVHIRRPSRSRHRSWLSPHLRSVSCSLAAPLSWGAGRWALRVARYAGGHGVYAGLATTCAVCGALGLGVAVWPALLGGLCAGHGAGGRWVRRGTYLMGMVLDTRCPWPAPGAGRYHGPGPGTRGAGVWDRRRPRVLDARCARAVGTGQGARGEGADPPPPSVAQGCPAPATVYKRAELGRLGGHGYG